MKHKNHTVLYQQIEDKIDLQELLHTILQGKWLILFFLVMTSIPAFIIAYGTPQVYLADTLLQVETKTASIPGLEDQAVDDTYVGTELELIMSRKNMIKAVEALKLDIVAQPRKVKLFSNLHKRYFSPYETKKPSLVWEKLNVLAHKYAWGNELIKVDRLDIPEKWLNWPLTLIAKRDNSFELTYNKEIILQGIVGQPSSSTDNSFSIFVSELTGLPDTEFTVIKLSKRRAVASLQYKIQASEKRRKTGIIILSLTGNNREIIVKTLDKVSQSYVEQNKSRSSKEASNALNFLEVQIKPVKEQVEEAEASLRQYRIKNRTSDLPQETQNILDKISEIDAELQKLSLSREDLNRKYTEKHPVIQSLNAQEAKLKLRKEETQAQIVKLPKKQQALLKIERDVKVSNTIYIDLLNKIQEFKIAKASTVGNAYIVDLADINESFLYPNRKKIQGIGILLGVILGLLAVFLRKVLRHTVDNPEKLEQATGIPVYATIPLSKNVNLTSKFKTKNRNQKTLLAIDNINDLAIESLRSLRTSLHFALHEAKNNIVMITGPSPNIGKSFVASNFAAVAAAAGQRVILIDADMRKGYVHSLLNLKLDSGLSDIITGVASLEDTIQTVQVGDINMDVITRGKTPPNPSELLMHDHFGKLLDNLSKNYDLVLIDSPPVHAVTDPTIIGSHAGVVFMVVLSERHSMKEIEHAVTRLSHTGIDTKGFIFNGYVVKNSRYGYGYGYGYSNHYGEYK